MLVDSYNTLPSVNLIEDKAALLMKERCIDFIQNPPENWDGAITYHTK